MTSSTTTDTTTTIADVPDRPDNGAAHDGHPDAWIDAEPFRALVRHLLESSRLPIPHLAVKLELPLPLCLRLLADPRGRSTGPSSGRPIHRLPPDLAAQLMRTDAISLCAELDATLSAHRARSAARALLAHGHRLSTLHRVTGLSLELLEGLAVGTVRNCSGRVDTALQAARVWAETHPAPAAGTTHRAHGTGLAA